MISKSYCHKVVHTVAPRQVAQASPRKHGHGQGFYDAVKRLACQPDTYTLETLMADIHIERKHALGLQDARHVARLWAAKAQEKFGIECSYREGQSEDLLSFGGSGMQGTLAVTQDCFVVDANLGLMLGMFKDKIEAGIVKNLDTLMAHQSAVRAETAPHQKRRHFGPADEPTHN